jgi:hypothetical protein
MSRAEVHPQVASEGVPEPPKTLTKYLAKRPLLVAEDAWLDSNTWPQGGDAVYLASEVAKVIEELAMWKRSSETLEEQYDGHVEEVKDLKAQVATLRAERDEARADSRGPRGRESFQAGQAAGAGGGIPRAELLAASDKLVLEARDGEKRMLRKLEDCQRENYELRQAGGGVSPLTTLRDQHLRSAVALEFGVEKLLTGAHADRATLEARLHRAFARELDELAAVRAGGPSEAPDPPLTADQQQLADDMARAAGGGVSPHSKLDRHLIIACLEEWLLALPDLGVSLSTTKRFDIHAQIKLLRSGGLSPTTKEPK